MRLCIGTAKGIVILDPSRGGTPLMVLADPSAVWCMTQDAADPNLIYAGSTEQIRGKGTLARSTDGGRTWTGVTPPLAREEEVWSIAASPAVEALSDGVYEDIHPVAGDSRDSRRLYATTGGGFYLSNNAGKSWDRVTRGLNRTYTIPLLVSAPDRDDLFTAAAMGPPPSWRVGPTGADAMLFRSADRGESFAPISDEQNFGRGMVMRLKADPENSGFFVVCNDGAGVRASTDRSSPTTIAEKLPSAYDLPQ